MEYSQRGGHPEEHPSPWGAQPPPAACPPSPAPALQVPGFSRRAQHPSPSSAGRNLSRQASSHRNRELPSMRLGPLSRLTPVPPRSRFRAPGRAGAIPPPTYPTWRPPPKDAGVGGEGRRSLQPAPGASRMNGRNGFLRMEPGVCWDVPFGAEEALRTVRGVPLKARAASFALRRPTCALLGAPGREGSPEGLGWSWVCNPRLLV